MTSLAPTSHHWTLRLKHGRTTVLVLALPVTHFHMVKSDLINALVSSGKTSLGGHDLATTKPEDLEFAAPIDRWNLNKGWVSLDVGRHGVSDSDEGSEDDYGNEVVGKKMDLGKKQKNKGKEPVLNSSPQAAGLKDGAVLAFRWRGDTDVWDVIVPSYDDEAPATKGDAMDED